MFFSQKYDKRKVDVIGACYRRGREMVGEGDGKEGGGIEKLKDSKRLNIPLVDINQGR